MITTVVNVYVYVIRSHIQLQLLQLLLLPQQHLLLLLLHVCHAQPFSDQWFVWRQLPILFFRVSGKG